MVVDHSNDGRRGLGSLLRDLAEGSAELVRGEVRLARIELGSAAGAAAKGTAYTALGGVLLLLGTLAAFTGLILLIGDQWLPRDLYWLGALFVELIEVGVAVWLDAPFSHIVDRVPSDGRRPLAGDREAFATLFEQRRAVYRLAHLRIDAQGRVEALVERLLDKLGW